MNLFVIALSLALFHGSYIYGLESEELSGVDVLAELAGKVPACKLTRFVKTEKDYNELKSDLQKYCSASDTLKQYRILCNMLLYELQKACALSEQSGPSPAIYITQVSAQQICFMRNLKLTNQWIWNRITNDGNKKISVTSKELCSQVTSQSETLRLARFFYKIAPRVRVADSQGTKALTDKIQSDTTSKTSTESVSDVVKNDKDNFANATQLNKEQPQQSVETDFKKTNESVNQMNDNTTKLGDRPKEKIGETAEVKKGNADQTVDGTKNTTGQVVENEKNNVGTTTGSVKDKTTQVVDAAENNVVPNSDDAKDKAAEAAMVKVESTVNTTTSKSDSNLNVSSNLENKTTQVDLDKSKQAGESLVGKTTDAIKLSDSTVKEVSTTNNQSAEQVLDLKKDNKTDLQTQKDQTNANEDADDDKDDEDKQESKDNQQSEQISKPDLPTKKDDDKDDSKKSESPIEKTKDVEETNVNGISDAANEVGMTNKQATDGDDEDGIKKDDRNDEQDENDRDKVADEEAEKQLKDQQVESDKNDYQTAIDNKDKTEDDDGTKIDFNQQNEKTDPSENEEDGENQGINKSPTGLEIKKPSAEERNRDNKASELNIKDSTFDSSRTRIKSPSEIYPDDDGWSGNFVTYFLLFTLFVVVGYLVLHNKNKLMAYVVEGRRSAASRTGSRPSHRGYEKLKNVNDIIPIDDTNPIADKEAIILKA